MKSGPTTARCLGVAILVGLLPLILASYSVAHEKGLNAGSWTKGATLKVFVDALPADPPEGITQEVLDMSVADAVKVWNEAQAEFGGLMLMTAGATKENADIHIGWGKKLDAWGTTRPKDSHDKDNNGFGKETVRMEVEINDGLNQRGITRVLIHELGHAEGLGHSAASDIMKADAYSSKPGQAPSAADLNAEGAIMGPTADDKAGKKELWGTAEKLNKAVASGQAQFVPVLNGWIYTYQLLALDLIGVATETPITSWHLTMGPGVGPTGVQPWLVPDNWHFQFFDGNVTVVEGTKLLDSEAPLPPSLFGFSTLSMGNGLLPNQGVTFQVFSPFGPAMMPGHSNSPSFDSDDFLLPSPVPEPAGSTLAVAGALLAWAIVRRRGGRNGRA